MPVFKAFLRFAAVSKVPLACYPASVPAAGENIGIGFLSLKVFDAFTRTAQVHPIVFPVPAQNPIEHAMQMP
jgi:hypothetical protein